MRVSGRFFWGVGGLFFVLAIAARWMTQGVPAASSSSQAPELTISTYRSFVGKSGLGTAIIPLFEQQCRCKVRVLTQPDGGALLTRLELDVRRGQFPAQAVLGLDQYLWGRAQPYAEDWGDWKPQGYDRVEGDLKLGGGFLPYDFAPLAWIANPSNLPPEGHPESWAPPRKLTDLLDSKWSRQLLLEDPRTSTPGLTFLLFTRATLGDGAPAFWKSLRSQWLTLAPSWDSAYTLFMKGEAPLVWSYLPSLAYHQSKGEGLKYRAILFEEGQPFQVEGAILVKGSFQSQEQKKLAQQFMEFLISPQIQALVPHSTWMLPVLPDLQLPTDFLNLPKATRRIWPDHRPEHVNEALDEWRRVVGL